MGAPQGLKPLGGGTRTATVTAESDMRTYALPVWSFRSFVESRPAVTWKLLELLADTKDVDGRGVGRGVDDADVNVRVPS